MGVLITVLVFGLPVLFILFVCSAGSVGDTMIGGAVLTVVFIVLSIVIVSFLDDLMNKFVSVSSKTKKGKK